MMKSIMDVMTPVLKDLSVIWKIPVNVLKFILKNMKLKKMLIMLLVGNYSEKQLSTILMLVFVNVYQMLLIKTEKKSKNTWR